MIRIMLFNATFQQYFSYIVEVSRENRSILRKPPTWTQVYPVSKMVIVIVDKITSTCPCVEKEFKLLSPSPIWGQ